jgi:hypothetical protein
MLPVAVLSLHDPDGMTLPHLEAALTDLRSTFDRAFLSLTAPTVEAQTGWVDWLEGAGFFHLTRTPPGALIGEQLVAVYRDAVEGSLPGEILHLCFPDRVAFALLGGYRDRFVSDVHAAAPGGLPLLYQRSEAAWRTHPRNYCRLEGIATRVGEMLLGRALDLTWCHLAIERQQLADTLPWLTRRDFSVLTEIVLRFREVIETKDVDWLAWEDPFILGQNADQLRASREESTDEVRKRLAYVIPVLEVLAGHE